MADLVASRLASLRAVLMQSDAEIRAQFPECFHRYYSYLRIIRNPARIEHMFQKARDMHRFLDAGGREILDLGAGFGLDALLIAIYGAKRVVAVEIDQDMIRVGQHLGERMNPPMINFESKYGDGIAMESPAESFDGVMANCVISHTRDLEGFLKEVHRLLRPGGIFFLSDENNSLFLPFRRGRHRLWRQMEAEPDGSFFVARRAYVGKHFPTLNGNELTEAVRLTRGLFAEQILNAVREWRETGHSPAKPDFLYRHPIDGQYPERELNPFWLMQKFREAGLAPELLPAFFSRGIERHPRQVIKDVLRLFCTRWPSLSVCVWPIMRLRGRKAGPTPGRSPIPELMSRAG
jgi:SAM-dependent methyltransferase